MKNSIVSLYERLCLEIQAFPAIFLTLFALLVLLVLLIFIIHVLFVFSRWKKRAFERKILKNEEKRKVEFALPERENSFIRARLNVLRVEEVKENLRFPLCFSYVDGMLKSLSACPLIFSEKIELQNMQELLQTLINKDFFTSNEVKKLNDTFNRLLKLSAKYDVDVKA